jgi:RNA polymerase-binding protein DksA
MTKADLAKYHDELKALAARLGGDVAGLRQAALRVKEDPDGGEPIDAIARNDDLAKREADQEVTLGLLETEQATLAEVAAALARIEAGTFGVCLACGKPIAAIRLSAVPYARHCIDCANRQAK